MKTFLPQSRPATDNTEFNAISFLVKQMLGSVNVATLVQVVKVYSGGRTAAAGLVDVQPLINQVDGSGQAVPHGVINNVPWLRLQGGAFALIVDPVPGDIGLLVTCDRDISKVKTSKQSSNPGSRRRFNLADSFYIGGWGMSSPSSYVLIDDTSLDVVSSVKVNINAPSATINANTTVNGTLHVTGTSALDGAVTGNSTATFSGDVVGNGTHLHTHVHSGVQSGGSNTGAPV